MARYWCTRCGADCNTSNDPHLCADLKKRYERQARQIEATLEIMIERLPIAVANADGLAVARECAVEIVRALNHLGVQEGE